MKISKLNLEKLFFKIMKTHFLHLLRMMRKGSGTNLSINTKLKNRKRDLKILLLFSKRFKALKVFSRNKQQRDKHSSNSTKNSVLREKRNCKKRMKCLWKSTKTENWSRKSRLREKLKKFLIEIRVRRIYWLQSKMRIKYLSEAN